MNAVVVQYYRDPAVLARILEFCGVPPWRVDAWRKGREDALSDSAALKAVAAAASAEYISGFGARLRTLRRKDHAAMTLGELGWALKNGLDIHRSIWDRESVIGTIDIEYFSKDFVAEPYVNDRRTFTMIEPWYRKILGVLEEYGFSPLVLSTGQGYNFDIGFSKKSPLFADLVEMGYIEPSLRYHYGHPSPRKGRPVSEADGRAFDALGKLVEFVFSRIAKDPPPLPGAVPLVIGDIVCGNERREAVSLDFSPYTNPLHKRCIRCAFSSYSKHLLSDVLPAEGGGACRRILFCLPRKTPEVELSLNRILAIRSDPDAVAGWAGETAAFIPDQADAFAVLMDAYRRSVLYDFHRAFDAVPQDAPEDWPRGYDRLDLKTVPPCVALPLDRPNPLTLQPTHLRNLVRVLMAMGWHPKHIAGLAISKYLRDFGWEVDFRGYDAYRWANGWVRIYAGMILAGTDSLQDFNCVSQKEKGYTWKDLKFCPAGHCPFNLADYREALTALKDRVESSI